MLSSYPADAPFDSPYGGHAKQMSEYSRPKYARCRSPSIMSASSSNSGSISVSFIVPKARPTLTLTNLSSATHDAMGAFTPTSPASASLRLFVSSSDKGASLFPPLPKRRRYAKHRPALSCDVPSTSKPESVFFDPSSIPSISRGLSEPSTPSSLLAPSPNSMLFEEVTTQPPSTKQPKHGLNPILASLEQKSRLCSRKMCCATCNKPGTNFPKCGRCGQAWCSRECRLPSGVKHVCGPPRITDRP
ncbi:hypothetical protein HGRIS_006041 [Hohenbuehelia grisea]|uniref:Uncharacterized protein n=1 Tax=Hohenbuehelia grisea TaxID=104357 RepID=A0ABR3K138_9AGAR